MLLQKLNKLNTWAAVCGSTMDQQEIPWDCEIEETEDGVVVNITYSSCDPQESQLPFTEWANRTAEDFFRNDELTWVDCDFDFLQITFDAGETEDRGAIVDAFSSGVPFLHYIGFEPNEFLLAAMEE